MNRDRIIRGALWGAVALNAFGVAVFLPLALGNPSTLFPLEIPRFFAAQIGGTIAIFGGAYAWAALQPVISRPLVAVGAVGKLCFFGFTVLYTFAGDVPVNMAWQASPDLVFGSIFAWWALTER